MNASHGRLVIRPTIYPGIGLNRMRWRCMVAALIGCLCIPPTLSRADEPAIPQATDRESESKPAESKPLEFTRVHVPVGRLADIPLGTSRYVPMSAREFEEGVARLSAGGQTGLREAMEPTLQPLADAARYQASLADDGSLAGTVSFDVGGFAGASGGGRFSRLTVAREMPLGNLEVRSGSMRTGAGMGEAVVFGRRDGTIAVATPETGTYTCDFRCVASPGGDDTTRFTIPLVPALSSSITLRLPRDVQPVVSGDLRIHRVGEAPQEQVAEGFTRRVRPTVAWQIETGPRPTLELALVNANAPSPMLSMWTAVGIHGRQASLHVLVRPMAAWLPGRIRIEKDAAALVTQVVVGGPNEAMNDALDEVSWSVADEGTAILIDMPPGCIGERTPIVINAVAPIGEHAAPLPLLRAPAEAWAGGGIAIQTAPSLTLSSIELERCLVVPPEVAARWPLPVAAATADVIAAHTVAAHTVASQAVKSPAVESPAVSEQVGAAPGVWPSRLFVEEQSPGAIVTLSLLPRTADLDVMRVTTVDLSPGVVVGRATCDVRVRRGEAFDLTARITPGWFIDSVEAITLPTPAELAEAPRRRNADEPAAGLDWKVLRDTRGDVLRIGLIAAVTPARGLGLRITGHRAGIALGEDFSTAEIDMVRLDGESERSALLDLRSSPETTVEFPLEQSSSPDRPVPAGLAQADFHAVGPDGRLAMLMEEGAARARLWAGFRAASRSARLVRRRPPLDARTQVRLTVRDDRLTEAVTFECHPAASDLDSIVVQFSEPVDDPMEWSLLPPAIGTVAARRLDSTDRRTGPGGTGAAGGERWLVELNPPARGAVTIRAARSIPFTHPTPVLLAWVDGATSAVGHCIVRNVGRLQPRVINRRLSEVPPESVTAEPDPVTVAEFSFDPAAASDPADVAAAELTPGDADGRAWAWRETTSSWCHASGATEYETLFEIDNHGRTGLTLSLPSGRRVQGILLDGVRLPLGERAAAGGQLPIELPAGRPLVSLLVRTVADGADGGGRLGSGLWSAWRVDAAGVKLDIPVLHREWRLLLPPELEIARVGDSVCVVGDIDHRDWVARLLAVRGRGRGGPFQVSGNRLDDSTQSSGPGEVDSSALAPTGGLRAGFRQRVLVPAGDGTGEANVVVVHARVLSAAAVLAGLAAGFATLFVARRSPRRAVLLCLLAGVAALWIVAPFDGIARAAWWASLAALTLVVMGWLPGLRSGGGAEGGAGGPGIVALLFVLCNLVCSLAAAPAAAAEESDGAAVAQASASNGNTVPMQVFITPIAGDQKTGRGGEATVLVPEELFRALVRGEDGRAAAAVRVMAVRVTAAALPEGDGSWASWRLDIDIDADAGGILQLDQSGSGARFRPGTLRIDGAAVTARLEAADTLLRCAVPDAGRQTVSVNVEAAGRRRGDVEMAVISLPLAPESSLQFVPTAGRTAAAIVCERAAAPGVFVAAARRSTEPPAVVFDVSRSTQVRLSRSVAVGVDLASLPPTAVSRNDIVWNLDECRLTGVYDIDGGDAIVRSCVVQAALGLEWIAPSTQQDGQPQDDAASAEGVSIRPLGNRRFLVERRSPERGRVHFEIPFRMALADAVGVFDVPEAWLENVLVDTRSVRFVASPSLAVRIDLPPGLTHADTPEGEASFETRFWRSEVLRSIAVDAAAGSAAAPPFAPAGPTSAPRARLTAERRRQEIRGSQREVVVFAGEQVRMHLDARLDASSSALVTIPLDVPEGCVVDRIELFEDDVLHPETADRGAIDLRWSRPTDTSVAVVIQRPRAGRFRLEVDARMPGRPAARGPMPCLRVGLTDGSRTLIEWRAEDGLQAALEATAEDGAAGSVPRMGQFELVTGEQPPRYVLESSPVPSASTEDDVPPAAKPAEPVADGAGRVELADIRLAVDERGRVWGLACFELVPAEQLVRLELPRSWRLFDAVVDGRSVDSVVPASSSSDNIWDLRLSDAGRPRTIVALFAGELLVGDLGRRLLDGEPLALAPPNIVGLPCRQVIWTVQVPAGISLRVAAPAKVGTAAVLQTERRAAQERLGDDFQRAGERSVGWQQDRLRLFQHARSDGASPHADQAWARTLTTLGDPLPSSLFMVAADGVDGAVAGRLTIRAVRQRDPTTRGRALATLSLLACGGLAWMAARRHWSLRLPMVPGLGPAVALVAGLAWIALLEPTWPGVLLATAAVAALIRYWLMPRETTDEKPAAIASAEATTIYRPQR